MGIVTGLLLLLIKIIFQVKESIISQIVPKQNSIRISMSFKGKEKPNLPARDC